MGIGRTIAIAAAAAALPAAAAAVLTSKAANADDRDRAFELMDWNTGLKLGVSLAAGGIYLGARLLGRADTPGLKPALLGAALGAFFGGFAFARVDQALHRDETARDLAAANESLGLTRAMFAAHGVSQREGLDPFPVVIDRNFLNAAYADIRYTPFEFKILGRQAGTHEHFAQARDVVAHELAHRVINKINPGMSPVGQAGAIDESLADTFAAVVDADDWTIGEDAGREWMRNMADPHSERYPRINGVPHAPPAHRLEYIELPRTLDSGGRHINMGIPNKAAYLIGSRIGRDAMAEIYIRALRMLGDDPTFADLARAAEQAAIDAYGAGSEARQVVRDAWTTVGYGDELLAR